VNNKALAGEACIVHRDAAVGERAVPDEDVAFLWMEAPLLDATDLALGLDVCSEVQLAKRRLCRVEKPVPEVELADLVALTWEEVRSICHRAEVPVVCPHSLIGLYATRAVESDSVSTAIAASLGHGSFAMRERHYASPESVMNGRTARVASLLPNLQHTDQEDELSSLRNLDPKTLARLVSLAQKEELLSTN